MRIGTPGNATLVAWLREATNSPTGRLWVRRRVRIDAQLCHPELLERLHSLVEQLPGSSVRFVGGIPLALHPGGLAFGVAAGQSWLMLRLPPHVHSALVRSEWGHRGLGGDWIDVDPWITAMEPYDALSRVRGWALASYKYVGELTPVPRVPRVPRRH